ncbi:MAG: hypothetical protein IKQ37_10260 [Bacteroidaceae bacterium]|nr:hypothetical protein [Bacteroidaceae bacterium]
MKSFSERYGYTRPSDALIIEQISEGVINAIINCLQDLENYGDYNLLKETVWLFFLNKKRADFDDYYDCIEQYLEDRRVEWYYKLNLLEFVIKQIPLLFPKENYNSFIRNVNSEFERLNYGYRIIGNLVTPITSKGEIESIEVAIDSARDNIKEHLNSALKHLADKENPDYRNSIKESISAVGVLCREMTGENDLGKALFVLEKKQGKLHPKLKTAFENLYQYVNEKQSGIRHELMDESGTYVPTFHEAKFMLVTCSAFINYINGKFAVNK